jgi:hypothetical protein
MTEEEIYNHPEFKLIKRILKREFKWIKDVRLDGDPDTYDTLIFLDIIIDPFECAEEEGLTVARYIHKNKKDRIMYLPTFFSESRDNPILKNIINEIDTILKDVRTNPALPDEYKMKTKKKFDVVGFIYEG